MTKSTETTRDVDWQDRLIALETRLDALRDEVRTRRVAVVDDRGAERCAIGVDPSGETVELRLTAPKGRSGVLVTSLGDAEGSGAFATLDDRGDIAVMLDDSGLRNIDEIRARRLVVIDDDGFERLTAGMFNDSTFQLHVRCTDDETYLTIQADNESDVDVHEAGVYLYSGDQVGSFATSGGETGVEITRSDTQHRDTARLDEEGVHFVPSDRFANGTVKADYL